MLLLRLPSLYLIFLIILIVFLVPPFVNSSLQYDSKEFCTEGYAMTIFGCWLEQLKFLWLNLDLLDFFITFPLGSCIILASKRYKYSDYKLIKIYFNVPLS